MKYKTKKTIKIICAVVSAILGCALLVHVGGSFKTNDSKNLIDVSADEYIKTQDPGYGVTVDVDEDNGVITFKGKATEAYTVKVTEVTLLPGTYKISGLDECTKNGFNMHVKSSSEIIAYSGVENINSNSVSDTFTLDAATAVTVWIYWPDDYEFTSILKPFGTKILPVISEV